MTYGSGLRPWVTDRESQVRIEVGGGKTGPRIGGQVFTIVGVDGVGTAMQHVEQIAMHGQAINRIRRNTGGVMRVANQLAGLRVHRLQCAPQRLDKATNPQ